ncbi:hypothetical protein LPJ73_001070 [Coemansia sp. RSA 2703]|nr:hypothetical protein LPJ73_001070 [Coemansia sp. RSA 2703]KAJ2378566.1 hypothetical protein IW150_000718 [Coemansia sp. RSA 2607]KAJ2396710.1 hypothetical protein GGI05_001001 [Coemansia sp. RSA 2603]
MSKTSDTTSLISQVDGCDFTTEELQQFHGYYKYTWPASLENSTLAEKIQHYTTVDPSIDSSRLRLWLQTMGIRDESEKTEEAKLYDRFEAFDFSTAPGFSELLTGVFIDSQQTNKHEINERMERAKIEYYSRIEDINYDKYRKYKEENAPKPVCPYQHLWEKEKEAAANVSQIENVTIIDLANYSDDKMTTETLNLIREKVIEAEKDADIYALAIIRSSADHKAFLPALSTDGGVNGALDTLRARMRLEVSLRKLNTLKPVIFFASGSVDPSTLALMQTTSETVLSDSFSIDPTCAPHPTSIQSWAQMSDLAPGTVEYILCHPNLIIRGSEWQGALGLGRGFISQRNFANATERILIAASCPPPHTRNALRQACVIESVYPGPCKISVWKPEIQKFFAPLAEDVCSASASLDRMINEVDQVGKPWAEKYLTFAGSSNEKEKRAIWIAALRACRQMEYSQALALEYNLTETIMSNQYDNAETATSLVERVIADGLSIAQILDADNVENQTQDDAIKVEIPGECPFAKMYRKNPERFKNIDLKAISDHRSLNFNK